MFDNLRADLRRAGQVARIRPGQWGRWVKLIVQMTTWAVIAHRFAHWVTTVRIPVVRQLLLIVSWLVRRWVGLWTGIYVDPKAEIGPGFHIHTAYAVLVGRVKIGANCTIQSGVLMTNATRSIGDNVYFGAGAKVVGDVKIGNNVSIMPNSLVLADVPDNSTVVGVPARIRLPRGEGLREFYPEPPTEAEKPPSPASKKEQTSGGQPPK